MESIAVYLLLATPYPPAPLYQQVLIGVLGPPIGSAVLCLIFKARGAALGTSNSRVVRNATDWVAFVAFTACGYAVFTAIAIYAHFRYP